MAARYLTVTYVTRQVGHDFLIAAFNQTATTFSQVSAAFYGTVEAASGIVGSKLRKMGYDVPSTSTSAQDVMAITFAVFYEMLCGRPENNLRLPETWTGHPAKLLYEELKLGDAHLSLSYSTKSAVGGVKFDKPSATASENRVFRREGW